MKSYVFLSGLPRTGSTLLASILAQNPKIHAEGSSATCQLMWDMHLSFQTDSASEAIGTSGRDGIQTDLIQGMFNTYYKNVEKPIVIDKCRSWAIPENVELIKKYITPNPKIIVMVRPVDEVFKSFGKVNPDIIPILDLYEDPIYRSFAGALNAKQNNQGEFLTITYDELVTKTLETLHKIYSFCCWDTYTHDLGNITKNFTENDTFHEENLVGLHDIRSTIGKQKVEFELPEHIVYKCNEMNKVLFA